MSKRKKIALIAGIIIVAWVAINLSIYYSDSSVRQQIDSTASSESNLGSPSSTSVDENRTDKATSTVKPATTLQPISSATTNSGNQFSASVLSLYPTRDEIGTTWVIEKPELVFSNGTMNNDYFKCNDCVLPSLNRLGDLTDLNGLVEAGAGTYRDYSRVHIVTLKFDSHDDAYLPYQETFQGLYKQGGFEKVDVSSITEAECFGIKPNIHDISSGLYCVKENVLFYIHNNWVYDEEANLMFAKMVAHKI